MEGVLIRSEKQLYVYCEIKNNLLGLICNKMNSLSNRNTVYKFYMNFNII